MAIPPEFKTPEIVAIDLTVEKMDIADFLPLTRGDVCLLGAYIQTFNFIELSLRRCVQAFGHAGIIEKRTIPASRLSSEIAKAIRVLEADHESRAQAEDRLHIIERRREMRNLVAHWAGRRIPDADAFVFFSADDRDRKESSEQARVPDWVRRAVVRRCDIERVKQEIAILDRWLARKTSEWIGTAKNLP